MLPWQVSLYFVVIFSLASKNLICAASPEYIFKVLAGMKSKTYLSKLYKFFCQWSKLNALFAVSVCTVRLNDSDGRSVWNLCAAIYRISKNESYYTGTSGRRQYGFTKVLPFVSNHHVLVNFSGENVLTVFTCVKTSLSLCDFVNKK